LPRTDQTPSSWPAAVFLADEHATARLAALVGSVLAAGDTIALSGGLGAGKTTFARAMIRSLAGMPGLEVPSPTFTLVQSYSETRIPVSHFDFYRLRGPQEVAELGLDDATIAGAAIVEWPERAGRLPGNMLRVALDIEGNARRAVLSGSADWANRLVDRLVVV
jgi:tRNA threonylcarbamoyl adenosine modification protein YjeE